MLSYSGHTINLPLSYTVAYSIFVGQGNGNSNVSRITNVTLTSFCFGEDDWNQIHKLTDKYWGTVGF